MTRATILFVAVLVAMLVVVSRRRARVRSHTPDVDAGRMRSRDDGVRSAAFGLLGATALFALAVLAIDGS